MGLTWGTPVVTMSTRFHVTVTEYTARPEIWVLLYRLMHFIHIMEIYAFYTYLYTNLYMLDILWRRKHQAATGTVWHCLVLNTSSSCGVFLGSRDGDSRQKPLGSRHCKTNSCSPWWACSVCLTNCRISRVPWYILTKEFFHLWVICTHE